MFLVARFLLPFVFFGIGDLLGFRCSINLVDKPFTDPRSMLTLGIAYVGFYAPNIFISNRMGKRQHSIKRAWPDALDLMLICVESGISMEAAMRRVSDEIAAAIAAARRGNGADHGRALLSAGPAYRAGKSRHAHTVPIVSSRSCRR